MLNASAENFDKGSLWEAKRLATSVHTIVYDGRPNSNSRSLLSQLDIRNNIKFVATGEPIHLANLFHQMPLVGVHGSLGDGATAIFLPVLDGAPKDIPQIYGGSSVTRRIACKTWWDDELIIKMNQLTLTRQKLVYALRNKDGGSHVDPVVSGSPDYVTLLKVPQMWVSGTGALTGKVDMSGGTVPISYSSEEEVERDKGAANGLLASTMRQIAWELLESLEAHGKLT